MSQLEKLENWTLTHAFLMLAGTVAAVIWHQALPLVALAALSFGLLIYQHWDSWKAKGWYGGAANAVTSLRLLTLFFVLLAAPVLGLWPTAIIASAIQFTDLLDGYLARKWKLASPLGAYFDKESDAFYNMAFCLLLFFQGAPCWVFIIGIIRYVYVPFLYFFKEKNQAEKRFPWGVIIAVIIMWGLPIAYVLPLTYQVYLLAGLSVLIVFSFARSFYFMVIS